MQDLNKKVIIISILCTVVMYNIYLALRIFIFPDFLNFAINIDEYFGLYVFVTNGITIIIHILVFLLIYHIILLVFPKLKK